MLHGTKSVLKALTQVRNPVVLITNRSRPKNVNWELQQLDIDQYFDKIIINNRQETSKADIIERQYGDNIGDAIICGDSGIDIDAGKALGIMTVGTTIGIRTRHLLERHNPDHLIKAIGELLEIIS